MRSPDSDRGSKTTCHIDVDTGHSVDAVTRVGHGVSLDPGAVLQGAEGWFGHMVVFLVVGEALAGDVGIPHAFDRVAAGMQGDPLFAPHLAHVGELLGFDVEVSTFLEKDFETLEV